MEVCALQELSDCLSLEDVSIYNELASQLGSIKHPTIIWEKNYVNIEVSSSNFVTFGAPKQRIAFKVWFEWLIMYICMDLMIYELFQYEPWGPQWFGSSQSHQQRATQDKRWWMKVNAFSTLPPFVHCLHNSVWV